VSEEFQPKVYLGWLENQRQAVGSEHASSAGETLLSVESGIKVFGQKMVIARDREGRGASPLDISPGSMVYLKAPSGTGKTTVMKMIMGLVRGEHLRVRLNGTLITERSPRKLWQDQLWGKKLTMVFQHADEALNPRSTVAETFYGLPSRKQITRAAIKETLSELFDFEIDNEFLNRRVNALSGGQKQRLNLLRSLFLDTDILLLDEPLNGLDFDSATKVLSMIETKQRTGKGILLVSHNEEIFDAIIPPTNVYYLLARTSSD
jgi:ABC-type dipeptide/oligopeptide/nickel transport system ATPase subunit